MLRFDGLYISKLPVDYGAMRSYSYLRFYDDGIVIEYAVRGDRSPDIISWFNKNDESLSSGLYNVSGTAISFSVRSKSGTVDYDGKILVDTLRLQSNSEINGNHSEDEYEFFEAR